MIPEVQQIISANKFTDTYSYSATDTGRTLKEKIRENVGIPVEQQNLYADYGWRKKDIQISDHDLLVNCLKKNENNQQTALRIKLFLTLRQQTEV